MSAALLGMMHVMPEWSLGTMPYRLMRLMAVVCVGVVAYFATLHNGWLLEGQIERNQQALEVLKPHKETGLYGADGQTATARIAAQSALPVASRYAG